MPKGKKNMTGMLAHKFDRVSQSYGIVRCSLKQKSGKHFFLSYIDGKP